MPEPKKKKTRQENEDEISAALLEKGKSPKEAAAWLANFKQESSYDPYIEEDPSLLTKGRTARGKGVAQWTFERRTALEDFAKQQGMDPINIPVPTQLDYLETELQGKEKATADALKQANEQDLPAPELSKIIMEKFERPSKDPKINKLDKRMRDAQEIYERRYIPKKETRPGLKEYIHGGISSALSLVFPSAHADELPPNMVDAAQNAPRKPEVTGPVMEATQIADATIQKKAASFDALKANPTAVEEHVRDADIDSETKEQTMAILSTPEAIEEVKQNSLAGKEQPSLAAQFVESLSFFAPQIAGMFVGALVDGSEGAVVGGKAGADTQAMYLKYLMDKEELEIKRTEARRKATEQRYQQSQYEDENGQPLIFDPSSGLYRNMSGSIAAPGKAKSRLTQLEQGKMQRFGEAMEFRKSKEGSDVRQKVIKAFTSDKEVVASKEAAGLAERALYLLDTNSPFAKSFGERALARLAGEVGVLTEKDVTAFADPRVIEQTKNAILQGTTGGLSENSKAVLKQALQALAKKRKEKIDEAAGRVSSQYSKATGISKDELIEMLEADKAPPSAEDRKKRLQELRLKYRK